jgi:hypothetical protein
MGFHADDEKSLGKNPFIASVSLGEYVLLPWGYYYWLIVVAFPTSRERLFVFKKNDTKKQISVILPSGSLLVMFGETQQQYKHSLPRSKVNGVRWNITFRTLVSKYCLFGVAANKLAEFPKYKPATEKMKALLERPILKQKRKNELASCNSRLLLFSCQARLRQDRYTCRQLFSH